MATNGVFCNHSGTLGSNTKNWGEYDFTKCLYVMNRSRRLGQDFRFPGIIWPSQPEKTYKVPVHVHNTKDPVELEKRLIEYITTTLKTRQPEDYSSAVVVNEYIEAGPEEKNGFGKVTPWTIVPDLICKAFKAARAAAPHAKLLYNDYNFESNNGNEKYKADKIYRLIKENKHCGIDGVGFQSHINADFSDDDFDGLRKNIR